MTAASPSKLVDPLSVQTLLLELRANGSAMSRASGFVVKHDQTDMLLTNWHVLAGRNADTGQPMHSSGAIPDEVTIVHHGTTLGTWLTRTEALNEPDGSARWYEHPQGRSIDVAALPLSAIDPAVQLYPFDLSLADTDLIPQVAMPAQIIGFPLGLAGPENFPIWKTGHIATDPDLDYKNLPAVLIDATTRVGMSGSPVVVRMNGGFATRSGTYTMVQTGPTTLFLGVYSGRIHADSEVGNSLEAEGDPRSLGVNLSDPEYRCSEESPPNKAMKRTLNSLVRSEAVASGIKLLRLGRIGGAIQRRLSPIRWPT